MFNLSLNQPSVPTCLKQTAIVPVPKEPSIPCLNGKGCSTNLRQLPLSSLLCSYPPLLSCLLAFPLSSTSTLSFLIPSPSLLTSLPPHSLLPLAPLQVPRVTFHSPNLPPPSRQPRTPFNLHPSFNRSRGQRQSKPNTLSHLG